MNAISALALGALLVGPLAGASAPPPPAAGSARLEIPQTVRDFGHVFEGTVLVHTFRLRSSGDEDLVIHKIKPSCGCTVAEVWRTGVDGERQRYEEGSAVPAGNEVELVARFDTQGQLGRQFKPVSIYHNGTGGLAEVQLQAFVKELLVATPARIDLGRLSVKETRSGTTELATADGTPVRLQVAEDSVRPPLSVELTALEPEADGRSARWRMDATLSPGAREGIFSREVEIETDHPHPAREEGHDAPEFMVQKVNVNARVLGLVHATPSYMAFGLVRGGTAVSKSVRVNAYDPETDVPEPTFTLLEGVEEAPFPYAGGSVVTVRPVDGLQAWDVELALVDLPADLNGAFRGRLVLEFGASGLPAVEIPFTGFHRPEAGAALR